MACRICKRSGCTESFHSLEDQERFDRGACSRCDGTGREHVKTTFVEMSLRCNDCDGSGETSPSVPDGAATR